MSDKSSASLKRYHKVRELNHKNIDWRLNKMLKNALNRSVRFDHDFNLDNQYLRKLWDDNDGCCSLTGIRFDLAINDGSPNRLGPSLDRINPPLGYIKGNVRLVTYQTNVCLHNFGEKALLEFAKQLIEYNEGII